MLTITNVKELLNLYRNHYVKSQQMLAKVKEMENGIYSAQAGFVENELGEIVGGGSHIARTEKISELTDLKDHYAKLFNEAEKVCKNILKLINKVYSDRDADAPKDVKAEKLALYENILVHKYISRLRESQIEKEICCGDRQTQRLIRDSIFYIWTLLKDNESIELVKFIKNEKSANIIINYHNYGIIRKEQQQEKGVCNDSQRTREERVKQCVGY